MKRAVAPALTMATVIGAAVIGAVPASPALAAPASPPASITLTVADNGRHLQVPRGEHVMVQLSVDPARDANPATWWHPITEQGRALQGRPVGTMVPRGMTAGHYFAVHRGAATLSSSRAVCPPTDNSRTCFAMQGWSVTVDVR
jgi:hypothetical protein